MIDPYILIGLGGALIATGRSLERYHFRQFDTAHDRLAEHYENGEYEQGAEIWSEYMENRYLDLALDLFLPCYIVGTLLLMWGLLELV